MYFALMYFARFVLAVAVLLCVWGCRQRAPVGPPPTPTPVTGPAAGMSFEATAYSIEGKTASGGTAVPAGKTGAASRSTSKTLSPRVWRGESSTVR